MYNSNAVFSKEFSLIYGSSKQQQNQWQRQPDTIIQIKDTIL